jgi:hypothetical protein
MKLPNLLLVVAALSASGCSSFQSPSSKEELSPNQSYWMRYDASRRGAIVLTNDSKVKICAEPAPDVGMSFINTLKGDFKLSENTSATGFDTALNATAMALSGRDNIVLLAREALFRICEANINGALPPSDVKVLFQDVFDQVKRIAEAQANKAKSNADAENSKVQQMKLQNTK